MKKLLLILLIAPIIGYGQNEAKINNNTITLVVVKDGVNSSDLHSRLNYAVANIFNSANDVVQLNDLEGKRIVVKGLAKIDVPNATKAMYKKNKAVPNYIEYDHDIALNIASKDGKYRLQLTYSDGKIWIPASAYTVAGWKNLEYPAKMDYTKDDIDFWISYWKKDMENSNWSLVGKKRRQQYLDFVPEQIQGYQNSLIAYSNNLFNAIVKSVNSGETDEW
jgi:hypothetical protein